MMIGKKLLIRALATHAVLLILASTALDAGTTAKVFFYGAIAFWIGAVFIYLRTKEQISKLAIYYLKYGLVLLFLLSAIIGPSVWGIDFRAKALADHKTKADGR